jgi:hypothetical protein
MIIEDAPPAGAVVDYLTVTPICTADAPLFPTKMRERGVKQKLAITAVSFALNRVTAAPVWNWKGLCRGMAAISGVLMEISMRK